MPITADLYYPGEWHVGGAEAYVLHLARSLCRIAQVRILATSPFDQHELRARLRIDGPEVELVHLPTGTTAEIHRSTRADLFINCSAWSYLAPPRRSVSAMLIYYAPELPGASSLRRAADAIIRASPFPATRILDPRRAIGAYDHILCASQWTGALVEQRWGRERTVLYPAVTPIRQAAEDLASKKERMVLTVGRIGAGGTAKGHEAMARLFDRMALQDCTFVVAGAVNYAAAEQAVETIERTSSANVVVVRNPSAEALQELYRRASLYWHAAGLHAPVGAVAHEHFGISIVEAMSAGAVPLVHASGGPVEVLSGDLEACLWTSEAELEASTVRLLASSSALATLRTAAVDRSTAFSPERFDERVDDIVRAMLA